MMVKSVLDLAWMCIKASVGVCMCVCAVHLCLVALNLIFNIKLYQCFYGLQMDSVILHF